MLDIKFIRENKEKVIISLKKKNCNIDIEKLISLDKKRRKLIQSSEELKAEQNEASKKISKLTGDEKQNAIKKMSELKERLSALENDLNAAQEDIDSLMRQIPNLTMFRKELTKLKMLSCGKSEKSLTFLCLNRKIIWPSRKIWTLLM